MKVFVSYNTVVCDITCILCCKVWVCRWRPFLIVQHQHCMYTIGVEQKTHNIDDIVTALDLDDIQFIYSLSDK